MLKNSLIIRFIFLLFSVNMLIGQEFYFKNYTVENGLSHNTVLSSLQDHQGFLWFGTKDGLNRFDGYSFRRFQNDPFVPNSLKGNYVESLHEFDNSVWVGTDNGLFKYNSQNENFEFIESTTNSQILDIENDALGNLWYIAESTIHKYNPETKEADVFVAEHYFRLFSRAYPH